MGHPQPPYRSGPGRHTRSLSSARWWVCVSIAVLCGCASSGGGPGVLDKALEMVGLSKPPPTEISPEGVRSLVLPKKITLRLHAGDSLNADPSGRPLSVVSRIYKLRNATAMLQAPYAAFKDSASERQAFGEDLVEMREVVLTPGKRYDVVETMPVDAAYLAVVALMRAPDPQRWKFVFETREAARTGVTLGVHACALSVAEGEPVEAPFETRRLAGAQCPTH